MNYLRNIMPSKARQKFKQGPKLVNFGASKLGVGGQVRGVYPGSVPVISTLYYIGFLCAGALRMLFLFGFSFRMVIHTITDGVLSFSIQKFRGISNLMCVRYLSSSIFGFGSFTRLPADFLKAY